MQTGSHDPNCSGNNHGIRRNVFLEIRQLVEVAYLTWSCLDSSALILLANILMCFSIFLHSNMETSSNMAYGMTIINKDTALNYSNTEHNYDVIINQRTPQDPLPTPPTPPIYSPSSRVDHRAGWCC